MNTRKMFSSAFCFFVLFTMPFSNINAMVWEVGIRSIDSAGFAIPALVTVYRLNPSTRLLEYIDEGQTKNTFQYDAKLKVNGAFDIGDGEVITDPTIRQLPGGETVMVQAKKEFC